MANLSLTTSPARPRSDDSTHTTRVKNALARTIESLNVHLASSLAATGEVHDHSRSGT